MSDSQRTNPGKSAPFSNGLSDQEAERLALLLEELGEAQQAIGKILRHGYESRNPHDPNAISNRHALERELGDVQYAIALIEYAGDVDGIAVNNARVAKAGRIGPYLHHQPPSYIR